MTEELNHENLIPSLVLEQWDAVSDYVKRAALEKALENTRPSPWQPIETAPRDGTLILVWRSKQKEVAKIRADDLIAEPRPHWVDDVTHWQLLPQPPKGDE